MVSLSAQPLPFLGWEGAPRAEIHLKFQDFTQTTVDTLIKGMPYFLASYSIFASFWKWAEACTL